MINKKISTIVGSLIILAIAITLGIAFVIREKRIYKEDGILKNFSTSEKQDATDKNKQDEEKIDENTTITKNAESKISDSSTQPQLSDQTVDLSEIQKQLDVLNSEDGDVTYTVISAQDYNIERGAYAANRISPDIHYIKYTNKKLGISFVYPYGIDGKQTYIKEVSPNKLQYSLGDSGDQDDIIEIYSKKYSDTLEEAIKKMIIQKGFNIKKCKLMSENYENGQSISVSYYEPFVYDKNKCPADSLFLDCNHNQYNKYYKLAANNCSTFETGTYHNYFIYQPENTPNKIAFLRHIIGIERPLWDYYTIKLFD